MPPLKLTLAVEHYDRHLPLLPGEVRPEGIDLRIEHVTVEQGRHNRMLNEQAWDACELSFSSYIMAKARGRPLTAVPVFPRRLFSQSQMYVNAAAEIRGPQDLIGKKVGLRSHQTTLSVLANGDLQHEYGVSLDQVTWVTSDDEPVLFQPPRGIQIQRLPRSKYIEIMLVEGEIEGYFVPRMPRPFASTSPHISRLFGDSQGEELDYYQRSGFYPIMHLVALREEVAKQSPWAAMSLYKAFNDARDIAYRYYNDPNWSLMAWGPQALRRQQEVMVLEGWVDGLSRNRKNLARFIQYELDQGLIQHPLKVEDFFTESTHHTWRAVPAERARLCKPDCPNPHPRSGEPATEPQPLPR